MTTEDKLKLVSEDLIKRLGEEILNDMGSSSGREKLRQIALSFQNLDIAYQRLIEEMKLKIQPDVLAIVGKNIKTEWNN